jgi:hypothetical protein
MPKLPKSLSGVALRQSMNTGITVDREAGVITGVSVITAGMAYPANAEPFEVDRTTLDQVAAAINTSGNGIKSRLTHPELKDQDGYLELVGKIRNARVEGDRVRADFHIGSMASEEQIRRIFGTAEDAPEDAGLSIVINEGTFEMSASGAPVGRIQSLFAVDWVGTPAANPAGMLSNKPLSSAPVAQAPTQGRTAMELTQEQLEYLRSIGLAEDASGEQIESFVASLDEEQRAAFNALANGPAMASDDDDDPAAAADEPEPKPAAAAKPAASSGKSNGTALSAKATTAERERYRAIKELAMLSGLDGEFTDKMFLSGASVDQARKEALKMHANKNKPQAMGAGSVTVGDDLNKTSLGDAVRDAIMLRASRHSPLVKFTADNRVALSHNPNNPRIKQPEFRQAHDRAQQFLGHSVLEMGRRYLMALGYREADNMSKPALAKLLMSRTMLAARLPGVFLAHSTGDFPELLADVMGKSLRAAYQLATPTWRLWCRPTTAPDFKDIKRLQLSEAPDLESIPEGEEYTYGKLEENKETYALGKFGKGLKFTREMLINDDLDAFDRIPRLWGNAVVRLEETTAINILTANANMADGNPLFHANHNNLTSGALSTSSLGIARGVMRKQTAFGSSDPLELTPSVLLVPEELSAVAEQLIGSTVDPSKQNATPNLAFVNRLTVASSARLSNDSAAIWYLMADYNSIDTVEMAFLEGEEGPVVEEEDNFDDDTRRVKVRHHIAAKAIDWRGLVRSSGS